MDGPHRLRAPAPACSSLLPGGRKAGSNVTEGRRRGPPTAAAYLTFSSLQSFVAMAPTRVLDEELLSELERVLARQRGNLLARMAPGRRAAEITAAFKTIGLEPSSEALLWWSWRDGSTFDIVPGLGHVSLATALQVYEMLRRVAAETAADAKPPLSDPDVWWSPAWIPIFDTGGLSKIALDCSAELGAPSPLRQVDWDSVGVSHFAHAFAPSLGEYIGGAVKALAAGRYRYDPDQQTWLPWDWADAPAGQRF